MPRHDDDADLVARAAEIGIDLHLSLRGRLRHYWRVITRFFGGAA